MFKKKFYRVLLSICLMLCIFPGGQACEKTFAEHYKTFCSYKEGIKVFHFDSGQTLVVKEIETSPLVSVMTWIKTGSINENTKTNGISHFLEHLLFKGTKKFKTGEIERVLESLGAYTNAATSKDFTNFEINIPSTHFAKALEFQADMLFNATIPPEELEKERKVVIEEARKSEDSPDRILFDNLFEGLFFDHPYILKTIGTFDNIEHVTRQEILDYYHQWYKPNNMVTIVVGNVQSDTVLTLFEKFFNTKNISCEERQYSGIVRSNFDVMADKSKKKEVIEYKKINNAYISIGWKTTQQVNHEDTYALDLLSIILGNGNSSRLNRELYEKYALVNSASAWLFSMKDISLFGVEATTLPENVTSTKNAILKYVEHIKEKGVTQEELNKAKAITERSFIYNNESSENIANSIGYNMTIGTIEEYTNYIDKVNAVNLDDIQKVAQKYLTNDVMTVSLLMPENFKDIVQTDKTINIESQKTVATPKIEKFILDNGLTIIVKPNQHNSVVYTSVLVKGGKLSESKPGLVELFGEMLLKGTKTRSENDIAQEAEESGISLKTSVDKQATYLNVKSTKEDFYKAFYLVEDILQNAVFPEANIEREKQSAITSIKLNQNEPSALAFEATDIHFYPPNHPYGYEGKVLIEGLPLITRDDLLAYYRQFLNPHNMIITVVGDVNPEEVKKMAGQIWARSPGEFSFSLDKKPQASLQKHQEYIVEKDSSTAWLIMSYKAPTIDTVKEYAAQKVITTILSGGLSSRLYDELREKNQLAYVVGAATAAHVDLNRFSLYIGTKPSELAVVKRKLLKEVTKLLNTPVPQQELENAKNNYLGKFIMQHETNANQAFYLSFYESVGLGYEFDTKFPDIIQSLTAKDIQDTAKKYFQEPVLTVIVGNKQGVQNYKRSLKGNQ